MASDSYRTALADRLLKLSFVEAIGGMPSADWKDFQALMQQALRGQCGPNSGLAWLETQDFYDLCQSYRHAQDVMPVALGFPTAGEAFERLKLAIADAFCPLCATQRRQAIRDILFEFANEDYTSYQAIDRIEALFAAPETKDINPTGPKHYLSAPSETNALAEARAEIEAFVAGKDSEDDIAPREYSEIGRRNFRIGDLLAQRAELRERVAQLSAPSATDALDAKRYRWLRDQSVPPHNFYIAVPVEFKDERYTARQVDAAIDAALGALSDGKGDSNG